MRAIAKALRVNGMVALAIVVVVGWATSARAQWTQWGGPHQDFIVETSGLASSWPEEGPPKIWSRDLGVGFSGMVVDDGTLYTLYRDGENDVVCALDAKSGKTTWEYKYAAPAHEGHVMQFTDGPRSTPLLVDGMLYTISVGGLMNCLDAKTGKPIWKHDLWSEYNGSVLNHGYSSSPIPYKDNIIVLVGGEGNAVMSFNKKTGDVVWKNQTFKNSYSTPKLIKLDGKDQLAIFTAESVIGVDPENGDLKWSYDIGNQWGQNICMPILDDGDNILFFSTSEAGSRGCRLKPEGDKVAMEELWSTRKIQFYHVNSVRIGDYIYGSSGTGSPNFFAAINMKTGDVAWRKRGFGKSTFLYADGKFIILDENGTLGLAKATPEDFEILSKVKLLGEQAWTIPTLVGKTLYLRDKEKIMALDLSADSQKKKDSEA